MDVTASSLWRQAGEALVPLLGGLPTAVVQLTPDGWLALSGEPVADFNMAYVADGPTSEDRLRAFAQTIHGWQLPTMDRLGGSRVRPSGADRARA